MKKCLTLFILPLVLFSNCTQPELIINYSKITVVFDDNREEIVEIVNSAAEVLKSAEIKGQEKFIHTIPIDEDYYFLSFGNVKQKIFLKPGFNLKVSVDSANVFSYEGKGAVENQILISKQAAYKGFGDLYYGMEYYKRDERSFLQLVDSLHGIVEQLFFKGSSEIDSNFFFYETKSLEYERLTKIANYEVFHGLLTGNNKFAVSASFPDPFEAINTSDNRLLLSEDYIGFIEVYFRTRTNDEMDKKEGLDFILTYISLIKEEVNSKEIAQEMAYNVGLYELNRTNELDQVYNMTESLMMDKSRMSAIDEIYHKLEKIQKGNISPNFSMEDVNGNTVSLSNFKGKLVYIDIWATWCKPCVAEIPHLKAMEKHFENDAIAFVSICMNDQKENWESMLIEKEMGGVQLFCSDPNDPFFEAYSIQAIPRFILIDKTGIIIDPSADRPSIEGSIQIIESYL